MCEAHPGIHGNAMRENRGAWNTLTINRLSGEPYGVAEYG